MVVPTYSDLFFSLRWNSNKNVLSFAIPDKNYSYCWVNCALILVGRRWTDNGENGGKLNHKTFTFQWVGVDWSVVVVWIISYVLQRRVSHHFGSEVIFIFFYALLLFALVSMKWPRWTRWIIKFDSKTFLSYAGKLYEHFHFEILIVAGFSITKSFTFYSYSNRF